MEGDADVDAVEVEAGGTLVDAGGDVPAVHPTNTTMQARATMRFIAQVCAFTKRVG